jgi:hypothetical protein
MQIGKYLRNLGGMTGMIMVSPVFKELQVYWQLFINTKRYNYKVGLNN